MRDPITQLAKFILILINQKTLKPRIKPVKDFLATRG